MVFPPDGISTFWSDLQAGQLAPVGLWGYVLLAFLVMVEGPWATLLGAAAAAGGMMKPTWVFVAASAGNLTADTLWYSLGYTGRTAWLSRYGHWLGLKPHHIARLENVMQRHAIKILFAAKLTAGLSIPALVAAGMARVHWKRWFGPLLIAECVWTGGLVYAGMYLTQSVARIASGLHSLGLTLVLLGVLAGGAYGLRHAAGNVLRRLMPGELPAPNAEPNDN